MKLKIIVLLVLFSAVLVSASISTYSEFNATTAFSAAISVDKDKIKGSSTSNSLQTADSTVTQEAAAQEAPVEEAMQLSE